MGEINFIDNGQMENDGNKSQNRGKPDIDWTKPEKEIADKKNKDKFMSLKKFAPKPSSQNSPEEFSNNPKTAGFFSRFAQFFKKKPVINYPDNRKEILAHYNEIMGGEKELRKNGNSAAAINTISAGNNINEETTPAKKDADKWKPVNIIKTDLIKDEATLIVDWQKNLKNLLVFLLLSSFFVAAGYGGLIYWSNISAKEAEKIENEIQGYLKLISDAKSELNEIDIFQKKLSMVTGILDRHIYWNRFFALLEEVTLTKVFYESKFQGDTSGEFKFSAKAKNYKDITDQIKFLKSDNKNIISADTNKGSLAEVNRLDADKNGQANDSKIEFEIDLKVKPEIFYKQ